MLYEVITAVELALNNGRDLIAFIDPMSGKEEKIKTDGIKTGGFDELDTWDKFFEAYKKQTAFIIKKIVDLYEMSESLRAEFA